MEITRNEVLLAVAIFFVSLFGSLALVVFVMIRLPPTYFCAEHPAAFPWAERHPALRWTAIIAKNILGALVVILGIVQSLPGIPGQGILTILIGVMLLDFPGKRRLERGIVSRPRVFRAINGLRARFGREPLVLTINTGDKDAPEKER